MKTLESQPQSNIQAMSTPESSTPELAIDYLGTVRRNAKRKVDNGAQFSSTKGKQSLLACVCDDVRSQLGIAKFDGDNKRIALPDAVFQACKQAIDKFWHNDARELVQRAIDNDAKITTRHGVLMSRIGKNDAIIRSKTDKITAVYSPKESEHRLCDTFGLSAAQSRMDTMLDNVGKYSREELAVQKRKIELLELALDATKK